MIYYPVNCSKKGQVKIQQMAFVLVALMIFFSMVGLIYFRFRVADIQEGAENLGEDEAKELVRKLSASAEFSFSAGDCSDCIDLDKVFALKNRKTYQEFWNLDYLKIERIYPRSSGECVKTNYPDCETITIIENSDFGTPEEAFVSLCRWEPSQGGYTKCEVGKIFASGNLGNE